MMKIVMIICILKTRRHTDNCKAYVKRLSSVASFTSFRHTALSKTHSWALSKANRHLLMEMSHLPAIYALHKDVLK